MKGGTGRRGRDWGDGKTLQRHQQLARNDWFILITCTRRVLHNVLVNPIVNIPFAQLSWISFLFCFKNGSKQILNFEVGPISSNYR